jgi:hypothetical protein
LQGHKLRQGLIIFIANLLLYLVRLVQFFSPFVCQLRWVFFYIEK